MQAFNVNAYERIQTIFAVENEAANEYHYIVVTDQSCFLVDEKLRRKEENLPFDSITKFGTLTSNQNYFALRNHKDLLVLNLGDFIQGQRFYDLLRLSENEDNQSLFFEDEESLWLLQMTGELQKIKKQVLYGQVQI